jgi:uncharacterized membrane protein YedE/YeeE
VEHFTPWSALLGGALIGLAASLLLAANGRIAGVSGMLGGLVAPVRGEVGWRALVLAGLVVGAFVASTLLPGQVGSSPRPLWLVAVAGLLVGVGTRLGNGCTSGHGVCGISRLSVRSLAATGTFMVTGALAAWLARTLGWSTL